MKGKRERDTETHMTTEEIKKIVMEMVCAAGTVKEKDAIFHRRYPEFAERYPALFEMACTPGFDIQKLFFMLELRDKIDARERTVEDASKEVGQALFDEYVKPIIDKTPPNKP